MKVVFTIFWLALGFLPVAGFSQDEESPDSAPVYVELGSAYAGANFPSPPPGGEIRLRNRRPGSQLPDPKQREKIFSAISGLAPYLVDFDPLDRDLLFVRSQRGDLPFMEATYPAIPKSILQNLMEETRKP